MQAVNITNKNAEAFFKDTPCKSSKSAVKPLGISVLMLFHCRVYGGPIVLDIRRERRGYRRSLSAHFGSVMEQEEGLCLQALATLQKFMEIIQLGSL